MANTKRFTAWKFLKNLIGIPILIALLFAYLSPILHPGTAWIIPFFGLIYPLTLIAALLFTVLAAWKRSRWALIFGGLLLAGLSFHLRLIAFGSEEKPANTPSLRIMSYNVHLFDRYSENPGKTKRKEIISYIHGANPDVMCFQEFYHQDKPTTFPTLDTLLHLFKGYQRHEHYLHKPSGRQNFGVTILSKYPVIEKGNVLFDQNLKSSNYCIYVDIVQDLDTFRVYNVHLQSVKLGNDYALFDESNADPESGWLKVVNKLRAAYPIRADQAKRIVSHIKNSPYPVIVCGDFNDTPMSYTYSQFASQLEDAFLFCGSGIGVSYAGTLPAGRIDYIFHSESLASGSFAIQGEALSDHYAILCDIYKKEL